MFDRAPISPIQMGLSPEDQLAALTVLGEKPTAVSNAAAAEPAKVSAPETALSSASSPLTAPDAATTIADQREEIADTSTADNAVAAEPSSSKGNERKELNAEAVASQLATFFANFDANNPNATSADQVLAMKDVVAAHRPALDMLAQADQQVAAHLEALDKEWQRREQRAAEVLTDIVSLEDPNVPRVFQEGAVIDTIVNDGAAVTVTTENPDDTTTETRMTKLDIALTVLSLFAIDSIMGTHNASAAARVIMSQEIISPFLMRFGLNTEGQDSLFERFGSEKYGAMETFIKTANEIGDSNLIQRFFDNSIKNGTLFAMLEGTNPIHLKKIFAEGGTQSFGTPGEMLSFASDSLLLTQELVDRMKNVLTASQRQELGIA